MLVNILFLLVFGSSVELKEASYDSRQITERQQDERYTWEHLEKKKKRKHSSSGLVVLKKMYYL